MEFPAVEVTLKTKLRAIEKACSEDFWQSTNMNPWGNTYRVKMAKKQGVMAPVQHSSEIVERII